MKYQNVYILASLSRGNGIGFYEVGATDLNGKRISSKKLFFSDCKDKGLIRRYDHTKKLIDFLNTQEGNQWFDGHAKEFSW